MPESIDSLRRSSVEVTDLPAETIEPDPMNPNRVSEEMMTALRADILERGFVQPVLVRPHEGKYRIIDGEHRWRVLTEVGAKTIPCVIDDAGEDDARLRLLSMNRLRGEFVPVRLAGLLSKLAEQMSEQELRERLGMPEEEFAASLEIEDAGADVDERLAAALVAEAQSAPEVLTWRLPVEVAEKVEKELGARIEAGANSRAEAMIGLLG